MFDDVGVLVALVQPPTTVEEGKKSPLQTPPATSLLFPACSLLCSSHSSHVVEEHWGAGERKRQVE